METEEPYQSGPADMPLNSPDPRDELRFGFVSIIDLGAHAYIGGYLLVNLIGRPLEFHCTEPVKPNRAQQILYGKTLEPFLFGEQVAATLVANAELPADVICTDRHATLSLRGKVEVPTMWVAADSGDVPEGLIDVRTRAGNGLLEAAHGDDVGRIESTLGNVTTWVLDEPFDRIREAVAELRKAA